MFKSYRKPLLGAAAFLVFSAGLSTSGAASASVVAQVGNSSVFTSLDAYNGSLNFYYQGIGSPNWSSAEQVAAPGDASSDGAVTRVGNSSVIAVQGSNGLDFYWQAIGSPNWSQPQVVAGVDVTQGDPSIAQAGQSAVIAAQTPSGQINFYYQGIGDSNWSQAQQVTGPASGSPSGTLRNPYSDPSITQVGNSVVIAATGPNETLWMFWQQIGTSGWHAEQIPTTYAYGRPAVAQVGQSTVIAAITSAGLYTYTQPIGGATWTPDLVATSPEGFHNPSIAQINSGSAVIVAYSDELNAEGQAQTALWSYIESPLGNSYWAPEEVNSYVPLYSHGDPTVAAVNGSAVIGVPQNNGTGLFYWESGWNWHPETIG